MPRDNYAIAGHGIRRSGSDLWTIPTGVKVHFLSYDDRSVSFGTLADATKEITDDHEKTPSQVVKTFTGNGTAQAKDYEVYPFSIGEKTTINGIIGVGGAFAGFQYAPAPGPTYFSDYVRTLPASRDTHVYLLACRGE